VAFPFASLAQNTLYAQGRAAFDQQQWEEAASLMIQAETAVPESTDALLFAGKSFLHLDRLLEADRALTSFTRRHPDSAEALYTLGLVQQLEDKPRESLVTFTRAAKLRTPTSDELRIVGLNYVLLNDYPDAIHWLEKAVEFDPNNAKAWYSLGRCDYAQSRFHDAEKALETSLRLNPDNMKAAENLGLVYSADNRLADAERSFQQSIGLARKETSTDEWPYLDYGGFLLDQDRAKEAISLLEQAVALNAKCAACHEKLGRALSACGNLQEGIRQLEQAVALDAKDPRLHYELGLAYRKAGEQDRAKDELALSEKLYGTKTAGEPK
jgi:tetratricopeptide (TPR) repeat protein